MEKLSDSETGCCRRFDPAPWDGKEVKLQGRLFLKERVFCIFHIPLNMDKVMVRSMDAIEKAGALAKEPLLLYDANSLFGADIYIAVSKEVPKAKMERISGVFLSKVFGGDFRKSGERAKEMKEFVKSRGKEMKKLYFFYTTCPKCAEFYGKNYTVLLAKV